MFENWKAKLISLPDGRDRAFCEPCLRAATFLSLQEAVFRSKHAATWWPQTRVTSKRHIFENIFLML